MKAILLSLIFSGAASAAVLNDVEILGAKTDAKSIEIKLRQKDAAKDFHFFVDVTPDDKEAFAKLSRIVAELASPATYRLDLEIRGFTLQDPGAYYRSGSVKFLDVNAEAPKQ